MFGPPGHPDDPAIDDEEFAAEYTDDVTADPRDPYGYVVVESRRRYHVSSPLAMFA